MVNRRQRGNPARGSVESRAHMVLDKNSTLLRANISRLGLFGIKRLILTVMAAMVFPRLSCH